MQEVPGSNPSVGWNGSLLNLNLVMIKKAKTKQYSMSPLSRSDRPNNPPDDLTTTRTGVPVSAQTNLDLERNNPDDMWRRRSTVFALKIDQRSANPTPLNDKGFSRSTSVSALYGIIIVLFGVVFPMTEAFRDEWLETHVVAAFLTYLYGVAFIFIAYAMIYEIILKKRHRHHTETEHNNNNSLNQRPQTQTNLAISPDSSELDISLNRFSMSSTTNQSNLDTQTNRESDTNSEASDEVYDYIVTHVIGSGTIAGTSYFLKGGTIIFAVANILYVALRIEGATKTHSQCGEYQIIYPHVLHLLFILAQTMLLLKDCKHVFRKHKPIARFGLAHIVATNLCVWLRVLVIEVVEGLMHQQSDHSQDNHDSVLYEDLDTDNTSCNAEPIMLLAGPYLFPFILEYSLVAMTAVSFMFSSVSIRISTELYRAVWKTLRQRHRASGEPGTHEHQDPHRGQLCAKSHFGLFLGIIVIAGSVISMVLFFYWNDHDQAEQANLCYSASDVILLVFAQIAVVYGLIVFSKFMFDLNESNKLDHILLLVSVAFYIIWELFQLFSRSAYIDSHGGNVHSVMPIIVALLSIIQSISQTAFIVDGMQRVTMKKGQMERRDGRGSVTFLIIANAVMWVFKSFQEKRSIHEPELNYFGEVPWTIINSAALPMVLFYRFHSSICLAHMWQHCYEVHDETVHNQMML